MRVAQRETLQTVLTNHSFALILVVVLVLRFEIQKFAWVTVNGGCLWPFVPGIVVPSRQQLWKAGTPTWLPAGGLAEESNGRYNSATQLQFGRVTEFRCSALSDRSLGSDF
jgi:hypothetical protein